MLYDNPEKGDQAAMLFQWIKIFLEQVCMTTIVHELAIGG